MASTLKHLRSSTADKRPVASGLADGQFAINTASGTPAVFFKDSNGGVVKVGPAHVGGSAPNATPAGSAGNSLGELWVDNSLTTHGLNYYTGSAFVNLTPSGTTTTVGLVELATPAETQAGTDAVRAVTPSGLQSKVSDSTSTTSSTTIASSTAVKSAYDLANAALPKAGGTVTGELLIGNTGSLVFEGSTDDSFETTIAVVDPTADRTITFPNITGTVVTTGDSGTVTSTMIANDTIVNADINSAAAIAYSKLALSSGIVNTDISASAAIVDTKLATISAADKVSISALNIDGATDIGGALENGDIFIVDDGAGGTNRKTPAFRLSQLTYSGVTGDITIASGGTSAISAGVIVNADVNASAAIDFSKLASLTSANILIGNASNVATSTAVTGDVTISNAGVTAIAAGAIVDADISASAEIAVSKLADGTARQLLQTDAAGTGVEWASNIDIPGTLDVTSAATFDSTIGASAGTAALPSITFTGDLNTGIYSPGADQVAISTNGMGRLFVYNTGDIETVGLHNWNFAGIAIRRTSSNTADSKVISFLLDGDTRNNTNLYSNVNFVLRTDSAPTTGSTSSGLNAGLEITSPATIRFGTNGSERARIDSSGRLGIGTSSPSTTTKMSIVDSTSAGIYLLRTAQGETVIENTGPLTIRQSSGNGANQNIFFKTGASVGTEVTAMTIDSSQRVGIGITSPSAKLDVNGNILSDSTSGETVFSSSSDWNYANFYVRRNASNVSTAKMFGMMLNGDNVNDTTLTNYPSIWGTYSGTPTTSSTSVGLSAVMNLGAPSGIALHTNGSERARIDSSGRLLIGTSTSITSIIQSYLQVHGTGENAYINAGRWSNDANGPGLIFSKSRGGAVGTRGAVTNGDLLAEIAFHGDNGSSFNSAASITAHADGTVSGGGANDMPGRLVFSTTADGASSPTERMRITSGGDLLIGQQTNPATSRVVVQVQTGTANGVNAQITSNTGTSYPWSNYNASGTYVGGITCTSTATSFPTSSDYRLKTNVQPLSGAIDLVTQLKPSTFEFTENPGEAVQGFIAHELQEVVPLAVIGEKDAKDANGNPIYQGVDAAKLVPLLTAALQEAIAKIESLEARLTAAGI